MWFIDLFGFNELSPDQVRENMSLSGEKLHSKANGRTFQCGTLDVVTLDHLRNESALGDNYRGKLSFQEVVGNVQTLHGLEENRHALFQAASQFNLLEMVGPNVTPEQGINCYEYDRTQGPACAIACGAGTVYRNYFVPVSGGIGQSEDRQIDCLDLIGEELENERLALWEMRNGYALFNKAGLQHVTERIRELGAAGREDLKGKLKIGIQWNTEVTLNGNGQIVSQAYCSALPVAYSHLEARLWEPFARLILEASYEATLYASLINLKNGGSNIVYLTLLGGGAFGNDPEWIMDALRGGLDKFRNTPLDVRVVSYGSSDPRIARMLSELQP